MLTHEIRFWINTTPKLARMYEARVDELFAKGLKRAAVLNRMVDEMREDLGAIASSYPIDWPQIAADRM